MGYYPTFQRPRARNSFQGGHNHREAIAAMDFFSVPTITLSVLYCFFVTKPPTARVRQIVELVWRAARCVQQKPLRRSWTEQEIDQVRELLVANPVEVVALKVGRSPSSVKHLCSRTSEVQHLP